MLDPDPLDSASLRLGEVDLRDPAAGSTVDGETAADHRHHEVITNRTGFWGAMCAGRKGWCAAYLFDWLMS
ncbi:hypothetical protein [Planomonospora sp. ID82291]|uniref:hypothetical protein n=1 Tax=Planomonospora sp. ID82291 TaxID=2738136 RepID=UPI0018C41233|nr:hypothetical protein [Planomonospora sp. ID82291]MBG0814916.1 hypothetical protein [Planomonospora sp. ID82291]